MFGWATPDSVPQFISMVFGTARGWALIIGGAVVGSQFGRGSGRVASTVAGAAIGGLIGNRIGAALVHEEVVADVASADDAADPFLRMACHGSLLQPRPGLVARRGRRTRLV